MSSPKLSVIMGCYNDETTIRESILSILTQTYGDFEFIIIDDASRDNTVKIIKSFDDNRIILIEQKQNLGLGHNLSYGMKLAKGEFVARMDADDVSLPNRFEKQLSFLETHKNVICLGTSAYKIGAVSLRTKLFSPVMKQVERHEEIYITLLLGTPMLHPSVMFNNKLLRKTGCNYNKEFRRAQDFELWSRLISQPYKMHNLKEPLVKYRYSGSQASRVGREEQIKNSRIVYKRLLTDLLGRLPSDKELDLHTRFSTASNVFPNEIEPLNIWINTLAQAVKDKTESTYNYFIYIFSRRWVALCRNSFSRINRYKEFSKIKLLSRIPFSVMLKLFI